jgi:cytochrome c peroxidase
MLFYDTALSRDGSISCASCHLQATGFTHVDHAVSHGIDGRLGPRNSIALVNLAWSPSFHWDGGVNQLDVQALNPLTNPAEMDKSLAAVVRTLNQSAAYRGRFARAFRGDSAVTGQRVLLALAQFTSGLVSYRSRYDKYVRHEPGGEFSTQELNGLALFRANCASCHREPLFTDYSFRNNGLAPDSLAPDAGRAAITGRAQDSLCFRVPSLRNIERTAPYMHDGRFRRLRDVLQHYTAGMHHSRTLAPQLRQPLRLSSDQQKDLIAFLLTLTDPEFLTDPRFGYPHQDFETKAAKDAAPPTSRN